MNQRDFRRATRAVCLVLALLVFSMRTQAADKPNIVFVLADDMGLGDVACYGGTVAPTPNIDRLAKEGVRFTRYYSASPVCSPSRAGLITGRYPGRSRITSFLQTREGNRGCEQADFLDPASPSLPRLLKGAGYATAHFGKWHLGGGRDVKDAPPFSAYGYDEHASTYESPEPDPNLTATDWIWSPKDEVKRWERTGYFVDKTLDFLARHKDKEPCFVNLWPDDVHTPWVPAVNTAKDGETRANLVRVLTEMDRQVGRLLDGLEKLGIAKETLVIFTSDNGPAPVFGTERTMGLRGSKLSLYEGGIRMPFLARWPGHVPAGQVDGKTVLAGTDMLPTFCAVAGVEVPKDTKLDGADLSAALFGKPSEQSRQVFWEYGRNEKWFNYPKDAGNRSPELAVCEGSWKLLVNRDGTGAELYDLDKDAQESQNLAAEQPEVAKRLTETSLEWRKSLP